MYVHITPYKPRMMCHLNVSYRIAGESDHIIQADAVIQVDLVGQYGRPELVLTVFDRILPYCR